MLRWFSLSVLMVLWGRDQAQAYMYVDRRAKREIMMLIFEQEIKWQILPHTVYHVACLLRNSKQQ
jgi:hypothetical protein